MLSSGLRTLLMFFFVLFKWQPHSWYHVLLWPCECLGRLGIHQLSLKPRSKAARRMSAASLELIPINAHDTWRPRCSSRASNGSHKQNENILQLSQVTTSPPGWVLAPKHQCTTASMVVQSESSWAFPESCTANESQSGKIFRVELCTELFYAIIHTLFLWSPIPTSFNAL